MLLLQSLSESTLPTRLRLKFRKIHQKNFDRAILTDQKFSTYVTAAVKKAARKTASVVLKW